MAEEEAKTAGPIRMVAIENTVENIRYKAQLLARSNKYDSAILGTGIIGFSAGILVAMILVVVPALFV